MTCAPCRRWSRRARWSPVPLDDSGGTHEADEPSEQIVGVLTYEIDGDSIEVVSIEAVPPHQGTGTALLAAAADLGKAEGLARLLLVTTNDNIDALPLLPASWPAHPRSAAGRGGPIARGEAVDPADRVVRHPDARRDRARARSVARSRSVEPCRTTRATVNAWQAADTAGSASRRTTAAPTASPPRCTA